jgi:hypothetical protein
LHDGIRLDATYLWVGRDSLGLAPRHPRSEGVDQRETASDGEAVGIRERIDARPCRVVGQGDDDGDACLGRELP